MGLEFKFFSKNMNFMYFIFVTIYSGFGILYSPFCSNDITCRFIKPFNQDY